MRADKVALLLEGGSRALENAGQVLAEEPSCVIAKLSGIIQTCGPNLHSSLLTTCRANQSPQIPPAAPAMLS